MKSSWKRRRDLHAIRKSECKILFTSLPWICNQTVGYQAHVLYSSKQLFQNPMFARLIDNYYLYNINSLLKRQHVVFDKTWSTSDDFLYQHRLTKTELVSLVFHTPLHLLPFLSIPILEDQCLPHLCLQLMNYLHFLFVVQFEWLEVLK